jgi:hypothetical protein
MKKYDKIKSHSTTISVDNTIMTIEKMLANHGVTKIQKDYGPDSMPCKLIFLITEGDGVSKPFEHYPVRMPINVEGMLEAFEQQVNEGLLSKKFTERPWARQQAARVAWRNALDLIELLLWHVYLKQANLKEVFLPWIYSEELDTTIYEYIEEKGFNLKLLPEGEQ